MLSTHHEHSLAGYTHGANIMKIDHMRDQIDEITGIIYSQIFKMRSVIPLHMSLLIPRTSELKPTVVYFPGGGFTSADYEKFIEMRMALAHAGFVVASVEYRVVPHTFPAPVIDAKAAIRYLKKHAVHLGIDPKRIGVIGDSAGGWLAQMVATTAKEKEYEQGDFLNQTTDVQSVVSLYGISSLLNISDGFSEKLQKVHESPASTEALLVNGVAFKEFAGASIYECDDKALKASPIEHIKGKLPPFLIMHGSADTLVSPQQSAQLYNALKAQDSPAHYILVEGAEHGSAHWFQPKIIDCVVQWFNQTLAQTPNQPVYRPTDEHCCL